jgi:LAO/AO transport system kinase
MIKAGIMEIADVFVLNKADLPGADQTASELRTLLTSGTHSPPPLRGRWPARAGGGAAAPPPPIVRAVATTGAGTEDLLTAIEQHRENLEASGAASRQDEARLKDEEILTRRGSRLVPEAARSDS